MESIKPARPFESEPSEFALIAQMQIIAAERLQIWLLDAQLAQIEFLSEIRPTAKKLKDIFDMRELMRQNIESLDIQIKAIEKQLNLT